MGARESQRGTYVGGELVGEGADLILSLGQVPSELPDLGRLLLLLRTVQRRR